MRKPERHLLKARSASPQELESKIGNIILSKVGLRIFPATPMSFVLLKELRAAKYFAAGQQIWIPNINVCISKKTWRSHTSAVTSLRVRYLATVRPPAELCIRVRTPTTRVPPRRGRCHPPPGAQAPSGHKKGNMGIYRDMRLAKCRSGLLRMVLGFAGASAGREEGGRARGVRRGEESYLIL